MGGFGRFFDWLTILQRAETIGRCLRLQNDFLYVHSETLWSILRRFRVKIGVNIGEDFNLENSGFCQILCQVFMPFVLILSEDNCYVVWFHPFPGFVILYV